MRYGREMGRTGILLAVALTSMLSFAQGNSPRMAEINELAWLSGSWKLDSGGKLIEEHWSSPAGGAMIGMSRSVKDGKTVSFEFLRIERREASLSYIAQPQGAPPVAFRLASFDHDEILFENPKHDFPQRIRYRHNQDGSITARIEDMSGQKGMDFHYSRAEESKNKQSHQSTAPNDDRDADRQAIRAHIEKIFNAFCDVDPATVRATHAQNWTGFTQTARSIVHGLDGYMANVWIGRVKSRADVPPDALVIVDYKISEIAFEFYGDVALVPYIADVHIGRAARIPAKLRSLDVYARVNGEWTQVGSNIDLHPDTQEAIRQQPRSLSAREREELLAAREAVWRAFFTNDQAALEKTIPEETMVIGNTNEAAFLTKKEILQAASKYAEDGTRVVHLEYPRTEMQRYGDTAILYTTYVFELENARKEHYTESGRGTEIFVLRSGIWVNSGWHLEPEKVNTAEITTKGN